MLRERESLDSPQGLLWSYPNREGKGHLVIAGWRAGVHAHMWSSLTFTVGGVCYPVRDESPSSLLNLPDQQKGWGASSQTDEGGCPGSPLSLGWWRWGQFIIFCDI